LLRDLDDPKTYQNGDPAGMLGRIRELPQQVREAWRNARRLSLPESYREVNRIVILGMGGSAIGGDLLRTLVSEECPVPILVCREYDVPAFVDNRTLVIASSYSGGTEETLAAFAMAREQGAKLVAVTTGGKLATMAEAGDVPVLRFSYNAQPRAALGHSFIPLLSILCQLGLVGDCELEIEKAAKSLEDLRSLIDESIPSVQNPAKQLAATLHGRLPVVYGAGLLTEAARRWKGQFNENSKAWAFYEAIPELNHNAVVGYEFPPEYAGKIVVVFLRSNLLHPRTLVRYEVTQQLLQRAGVRYEVVEARGEGRLSQVLTTVHYGDFVSYYLALLYDVDPTPVSTINFLKEQLAKAT